MTDSYRTAMNAVIVREPPVERDWREVTVVAPFKPAACTGLLGKRCTCGQWHEVPEDGPGFFASRCFWIAGVLSLVFWSVLCAALFYRP